MVLQDVTADPTLPRTRDVTCAKCAHNEAVFFSAATEEVRMRMVPAGWQRPDTKCRAAAEEACLGCELWSGAPRVRHAGAELCEWKSYWLCL